MSTPTPSDLDFGQCIQGSFDASTGRLRVDAELTSTIISPPGLEVAISDIDDSIKIGNGSGIYAQVTGSNALKVDNSAVTQPISVISLPLPSGASTSSLQATANSSLSSIDSKLTSPLSANIVNFPAIQIVNESKPSTSTITTIPENFSAVTLCNINSSRIGLCIFNDALNPLYIKLGSSPSTTSFTVKLSAGSLYELPFPCYTGIITGIWTGSVTSSNALVTELI